MLRLIIPVIIIISSLSIGVYFYQVKKPEQNNKEAKSREELIKAAEKLRFIWSRGRSSLKASQCHDLDRVFLRCNPEYLTCLFNEKNKTELIPQVKVSFPVLDHQNKMNYQLVNGRFLLVKLTHNDFDQHILLEQSCRETLLPEGRYAIGPYRKEKDFIWSSVGRTIKVDKNLVLNRELAEWMGQTGHPLYEKKKSLVPTRPAVWPLPKMMREYCAYRGKKLSMAHILDAAFFYKSHDPEDLYIYRGPYPWTQTKRGSFVSLAKRKKDFKMNERYCNKIPSLECRDQMSDLALYHSSPSWIGVFQTLGGVMEYTDNPLFPRRNINASSWYFPILSPWHEIGLRGYWDREGHQASNFTFPRDDLNKKWDRLDIGFRCMEVDDE